MRVNLNKARAEALLEASEDTGWSPGQIVAKLVDEHLDECVAEIELESLMPEAD